MNPNYAVASIALVGVLLTVGAQLYIGSRQRRSESLDRLFEKKLALYSEVYTLTTSLIRVEQEVGRIQRKGQEISAQINGSQEDYAKIQGDHARFKEELESLRAEFAAPKTLDELGEIKLRLDQLAAMRGESEKASNELDTKLRSLRDEMQTNIEELEGSQVELATARKTISASESSLELIAGPQVVKQLRILGEKLTAWDGVDPPPDIEPLVRSFREELGVERR